MLRVLLIHQLVLSLIVGPMLCCCTTLHAFEVSRAAAGQSNRESTGNCCSGKSGIEKKPASQGHNNPNTPVKCPCKDSNAKLMTVPSSPGGTIVTQFLQTCAFLYLDVPVGHHVSFVQLNSSSRFESRAVGLSTDDLLFTHHNLRC